MNKEGKKAMRKAYDKPRIAIEDFVLNQYIAGSCTVGTRGKNPLQIADALAEKGYDLASAAVSAGQFGLKMVCEVDAEADHDTICYHTQGSPLFTS